MKKLLLLVVVVIAMGAAGWITLTLTSNRASVNIETQKIRTDTQEIIEDGKELLGDTGRSIDDQTTESPATTEDNTSIPPAPPSDGSAL